MLKIETTHARGTKAIEVVEDIDRELAKFDTWLCSNKGAAPLTSYEKGILRTFFIYLIERESNVGSKNPV